jgi:hypothetical protein
LALTLLSSSCGSRRSPTGGPEDTEKPKVLTTYPAQFGQLSDGRIEINFSKSLDKSSVAQAVYIYPPIQNKKITVDKSTMRIRIDEKLKQDTNYYVTLSTRLKDLRGNPLVENQTLVFAHGKLNDLRLAGLIDYEDKRDNGLPVLVNLLSADSLMVFHQNVSGSAYAIESLNPASYILRAYIDKNNNGRYDFSQEPYFQGSIDLQRTSSLDLSLSYADSSKATVRTVIAKSRREVVLSFSEPVVKYGSLMIQRADNNAELPVLLSNLDRDQLTLLTELQDSTKYVLSITGIQDRKENVTTLNRVEFVGSTIEDSTPPQIVSTNPRNGTTVNNLLPTLEVQFSEIIPRASLKARLIVADTKREIDLAVIKADGRVYQFKPKQELENYRSHVLQISASDISGKKLAEELLLNFLPLKRTD